MSRLDFVRDVFRHQHVVIFCNLSFIALNHIIVFRCLVISLGFIFGFGMPRKFHNPNRPCRAREAWHGDRGPRRRAGAGHKTRQPVGQGPGLTLLATSASPDAGNALRIANHGWGAPATIRRWLVLAASARRRQHPSPAAPFAPEAHDAKRG